jgi:hypothetical protein
MRSHSAGRLLDADLMKLFCLLYQGLYIVDTDSNFERNRTRHVTR